jgi:hypothetical protein
MGCVPLALCVGGDVGEDCFRVAVFCDMEGVERENQKKRGGGVQRM